MKMTLCPTTSGDGTTHSLTLLIFKKSPLIGPIKASVEILSHVILNNYDKLCEIINSNEEYEWLVDDNGNKLDNGREDIGYWRHNANNFKSKILDLFSDFSDFNLAYSINGGSVAGTKYTTIHFFQWRA